jgi:hypothetical protein
VIYGRPRPEVVARAFSSALFLLAVLAEELNADVWRVLGGGERKIAVSARLPVEQPHANRNLRTRQHTGSKL